MITTNCEFLENELFDVVYMFKTRPETVAHTYYEKDGTFQNHFVVDGKEYDFTDDAIYHGEVEYKRYERRFAKLGLYKILCETYGESMPWGGLTGIRPTKLAYMEQENGRDPYAFLEKMCVEKKNIALVKRILENQKGIYEKNAENYDLFISVPFCPSKCEYCSFITAPISRTKQFIPDYIDSVCKEILASKEDIKTLKSVYVGGGTPLVLDEPDLEKILRAVDEVRNNGCEYTVEAGRPDVFTESKLDLLKKHGVTRICINPQSFSDKTLKAIGRKHTAKDLYRAFEMAKNYPFSVNADLIAGLSGETVDEFIFSLKELIRLGVDNITVHCLCLKAGAVLREECSYLDNPLISEMVDKSRELLFEAGYEPYYLYRQKYQAGNNENIGWTKPGKACVYNIDVMEEVTNNYAVGANAVSKRVESTFSKIERFGTQKDIKTYVEHVDELIEKRKDFFQNGKKKKA